MIEAILILALVLFCVVHEQVERKERRASKALKDAHNNLFVARRTK